MTSLRFRTGGRGDAERVALLHADSWRRHYRGAYADSFLDGDIVTDRRAVWSARLAEPGGDSGPSGSGSGGSGNSRTIVAEDGIGLAGFVHVVFDHDDRWGSLVDNLHVSGGRRRTGIGTALLTRAAGAVAEQAAEPSLYLWVLEQNSAAQRFYEAVGGTCVEKAAVPPPGGVPGRLNGSPARLRFVWPDASRLGRAG